MGAKTQHRGLKKDNAAEMETQAGLRTRSTCMRGLLAMEQTSNHGTHIGERNSTMVVVVCMPPVHSGGRGVSATTICKKGEKNSLERNNFGSERVTQHATKNTQSTERN